MAEILEMSTNGNGYYYFEGHSEKLATGMFPLDEKGNSWFCFEDTWEQGCMELQKIGFTATQILEAREDVGN